MFLYLYCLQHTSAKTRTMQYRALFNRLVIAAISIKLIIKFHAYRMSQRASPGFSLRLHFLDGHLEPLDLVNDFAEQHVLTAWVEQFPLDHPVNMTALPQVQAAIIRTCRRKPEPAVHRLVDVAA